jgi:Fic family protein
MGGFVRSFAGIDRTMGSVPGSVVMRLSRIDIGRGRQELYSNQLPALLTELALRARTESITASSALEGIVVPDAERAARIIDDKIPSLRTRSEQELAGYRAALDYLFNRDWRPLNVGLVLHLHRELFSHTNTPGGHFKADDNLVVDRSPDGSVEVRFVPVPAAETEFYAAELIERYTAAIARGEHHPVLLIGLFVLDLLTIHPFDDGNGRVARVLTNALLADAGYQVSQYVSLEGLIAESADNYYESLLGSTRGWHKGTNDPWPWLTYFVNLLARAYARFEQTAAASRSTGTKQDRVRDYVLNHAATIFRIADIRVALPGISDQTIRLALDTLKKDRHVVAEGTGRGAVWRLLSPPANLATHLELDEDIDFDVSHL